MASLPNGTNIGLGSNGNKVHVCVGEPPVRDSPPFAAQEDGQLVLLWFI
jgi:hypothetical protein